MLGARKPFAVLYGTSRRGTSMRVEAVSGFDCAPAIVGASARRKRAIRSFETIGSLVAISGRPARLLRERSAPSCPAADTVSCRRARRLQATCHGVVSHGPHGVRGEEQATDGTEHTDSKVLVIPVVSAFRGWITAPGSEPRNSQPRTTRSARRRAGHGQHGVHGLKRFGDHVVRAFRGWIRAPGSVPRNSEPRIARRARRRAGHGQHGVHGLKGLY